MGIVEIYQSLKAQCCLQTACLRVQVLRATVPATVLLFLLAALSLGGCVQLGQPVVTDRSADVQPPRRSDAGVLQPSKPAAPPAPVVSSSKPAGQPAKPAAPGQSRTYTVQRGETLYAIAWRFGLDHRSLARANRIDPPYTIFPGQKVQLNAHARRPWQPSSRSSAKPATSPAARKTPDPKPVVTKPARASAPAPAPVSRVPARAVGPWVWPVPGKPSREFSTSSKGMDFTLASAAPVRAAGSGEVVYAGNGIGGYEQLVIIKHSQDLLSAYSFNGATRVTERQQVKAGGKVADIRNRGRTAQVLHFELRRNGQPINPRSKLP